MKPQILWCAIVAENKLITSLNRTNFYYENILRIPTTSSDAAAYGTAMHHALQKIFDKMRFSQSKTFPSVKFFIQFFEEDMARQRGYIPKKNTSDA